MCMYNINGSSDNLPCYPPDRHKSQNAVYRRTGVSKEDSYKHTDKWNNNSKSFDGKQHRNAMQVVNEAVSVRN